jgi:hypothetical protein
VLKQLCLLNTVLQDVVLGLSSISSLQDLCLGDPFWGGCPVTSLSNYQTVVLAHLPQLSSLDTLALAQETKQAAAATSAKKQLYYSMRMRTLGRAVRDLCRQAQEGQQVRPCWHCTAPAASLCGYLAVELSCRAPLPLCKAFLDVSATNVWCVVPVQAAAWVAAYQDLAYAAKQLEQGADGDPCSCEQQQQVCKPLMAHGHELPLLRQAT